MLFAALKPINRNADEDNKDLSVALFIVANEAHRNLKALLRLKVPVCKQLGLFNQEKEMFKAFNLVLHCAYINKYNINVIIFSNYSIKWWKKVLYASRYV